MTCINTRISSNFDQIGPLTTDLAAPERLTISMPPPFSRLPLVQFFFKLSGNEDMYYMKSPIFREYDFGQIKL